MKITIRFMGWTGKPPLETDTAYLRRADLSGADLSGAYLKDVKNGDYALAQTSIVPEAGAFIGWKMCRKNILVKVEIPADAKRSNATGRKCRASHVNVLEVFGASEAISNHDGETTYRAGETVACDEWCEDRWQECAGGIHFFITKIEAENYL